MRDNPRDNHHEEIMTTKICPSCGNQVCTNCGHHHPGHVGGTGPGWGDANPNDYGDPYQNAWGWFYCMTANKGPCNNQSQINPYIAALQARWPYGPKTVIDEWNSANPSQRFVNDPPSPPPQPQSAFWNWVNSSAPVGGTQQQTTPQPTAYGWDADYQGLGSYISFYGWYIGRLLFGQTYSVSPNIVAHLRHRWPKGPAGLLAQWNMAKTMFSKTKYSSHPPVVPPMSDINFWKWVWKSCGSPDF
jgi:hypothetical protein